MDAPLGIIADDVTGALLIASLFEGEGLRAPVALDPAALHDLGEADLAILGTRLRVAPPDQARAGIAAAAGALRAAGCARIAYKACASFDSTAHGNIGMAADILSDLDGGAPVLFSAGYPEFDCTVHRGYLFYRGRLVSDSVKRLDPLTPMEDPDLVRFLSLQTRTPLRNLSHRWLAQGVEPARAEWNRLLSAGARHVLADTSDVADAEVTARLAAEGGAVLVASDPAIVAFGRALAGGRARARPPPPERPAGAPSDWPSDWQTEGPQGPGAVLVGSVGPTAAAQAAAFAARHPLSILDILDPRPVAGIVAAALDFAAPHVGRRPVGFAVAAGAEAVTAAQARFGVAGAALRAERILAGIAAGLAEAGIRQLVVSGGETSGAVVAALGIPRLRALPAGPLGAGFCLAASPRPMSLFLKSGKLGAEDLLLAALDFMQTPLRPMR